MVNIGYLGAGTWGFCLASLLASKGFNVVGWTRDQRLANILNDHKQHPHLKGVTKWSNQRYTTDLAELVIHADILIESVTSKGIRPVFERLATLGIPKCPIVITSKGIEQNSGLILPDVVIEVLGEQSRDQVGILSGPGYAQEVVQGLPTSVVGAAYVQAVTTTICELFNTPSFRVYPNSDIKGVAFGGALKNIIAIACGISDGLQSGAGAKAALMTRGLHEMRKLGLSLGCKTETFYGLAGMGDAFLTCSSSLSRNYRFGYLLTQGLTVDQARAEIGMVVEGAYTCVSALQLGKQQNVSMPITEQVYSILFENATPTDAVRALMKRIVKEEHL